MLFAVHCLDGADAAPKRKPVTDAHRAHLENAASFGAKLVMAGPLVADDGETSRGSLFLVEAPTRKEAEAFIHADPFHKNGIWETVQVHAFLRRRG